MLTLKQVVKDYEAGEYSVRALDGISVAFRKSEFVSILGPSGCGKTTLLNIIGGLDHYTFGDLIINGKSTTEYKDRDWDAYRNHSIGFVFQSYNLIPHQTVLSNVELALTISGVSKKERRRRAEEALKRVGLADQLRKKPNEMSGGQMQRVAIARALVNDPDILLADEPTGALDTQTSIQVMEILKEISKDKLVIMVTHNPELAEKYSDRIIKLLDGRIVSDSSPYEPEQDTAAADQPEKKTKKPSMSFMTAVSLSLNNLMTKKGRTILTAFAGSIGIIGIALILSMSEGINNFINQVQEDTLSSYPLSIQEENYDMSAMINAFMDSGAEDGQTHDNDAVYANSILYELMNSLNSVTADTNNLSKFKEFLDTNSRIKIYSSAVQYVYDIPLNIYTTDPDGEIIKSDGMQIIQILSEEMNMPGYTEMLQNSMGSSAFSVWEQMLPEENGKGINSLIKDQYELVYGSWPEAYNEVMLVLNSNNEISDMTLYALGLESSDTIVDNTLAAMNGQIVDTDALKSWSYEDICGVTFRLIPAAETYQLGTDGKYTLLTETDAGLSYMYNNSDIGTELKISGIIRPDPDAVSTMLSGSIVYTSELTDYIIERTESNQLVQAQLSDSSTDILTGLKFQTDDGSQLTDAQKAEFFREYLGTLSTDELAEVYRQILCTPTDEYVQQSLDAMLGSMSRQQLEQMLVDAYAEQTGVEDVQSIQNTISALSDEDLYSYIYETAGQSIREQYAAQAAAALEGMDSAGIIAAFEAQERTEADWASYYDEHMPSSVSESTYDNNLELLGYVDKNKPSGINIYADSFENKDKISDLIASYNDSAAEEDKIAYTDYVALIMSSITTIINAISYVLIAFVAISLVVSSIMIGIITYISVLERTKEIGILRAIGASKRDVSRVFNAETLIIGLCAGVIGIGVTLLLTIPINIILHAISGFSDLNAALPVAGGLILVVISVVLTVIAGFIPAKMASKKDPVEALRTE